MEQWKQETIQGRKEFLENAEAQDVEQKKVSKRILIGLVILGPLVYLLLNPDANILSRKIHSALIAVVDAFKTTK